MSEGTIRRIGESLAGKLIRAGTRPLLVNVSTEWCAPCRQVEPFLRKFAAEYAGRFDIVEIDGDDADAFKATWDVEAFPTLLFFESGRLAGRLTGFDGYPALRAAILDFVGAPPAAAPTTPAEAAFAAAAAQASARMDATGTPADAPESQAIEKAFDALDAFAATQTGLLDAGRISGEQFNERMRAEQHRVLGPYKPQLDAAMTRAQDKLAAYTAEIDAATAAFLRAG